MPIPSGWQRFCPPEAVSAWGKPQAFLLPDGAPTEIVAMGAGAPLIAVPPLVGWKESYLLQAGPFSSRYRFITFDLREPARGRAFSWDRLVADLDAVANAHALEPAFVIGHSLGGVVALRWALDRPEHVRALVLSSTFAHIHFGASVWWNRFVAQGAALLANVALPAGAALAVARSMARRNMWIYDGLCDTRTLEFIRWSTRNVDLGAARARVMLAVSSDLRRQLSEVRVPVLVLWGEAEPRYTREAGMELVRGIPGAEHAVIPGANHMSLVTAARAFNEIVCGWLAGK